MKKELKITLIILAFCLLIVGIIGGTKVEYTEMPEASETTVDAQWAEQIATPSMVGKYADIDGNGTVDGLIVIDLLNPPGTNGSGQWNPSGNSSYASYGAYSVTAESSSAVKKYYISKTENANSKFGSREVVAPEKGTSGNDRFYVLQLSDITYGSDNLMYWYYSAYGNMTVETSTDFGTGKTNTATIKAKWDKGASGGYGAQKDKDMWKNIATQISNGWFVPSIAEWSAIGASLGVDKSNYNSTYGLSSFYWSSSQNGANGACCATFYGGYMYGYNVEDRNCVRLATTF